MSQVIKIYFYFQIHLIINIFIGFKSLKPNLCYLWFVTVLVSLMRIRELQAITTHGRQIFCVIMTFIIELCLWLNGRISPVLKLAFPAKVFLGFHWPTYLQYVQANAEGANFVPQCNIRFTYN